MKAEKFSESLNNVNDKYIEEAASLNAPVQDLKEAPVPPANNSAVKGLRTWRIIAIAACAVLVAGIAVAAIGLSSSGRKGSAVYNGAAVPDYAPSEEPAGGAESYQFGTNAGGGAQYYSDEGVSEYSASGESKDGIAPEQIGNFTSPHPAGENAKIIYTAHMNIETTEFDAAQKAIETATTKCGGYYENMDISNTSASYRSASFLIRIPAEQLDAFLNESGSFGNVKTMSKNAEDVSEYYYDTEARLESERAKLKRLQELYAQASDMTDIITIENQISSVQWNIDSLSGELKHYDSKVQYSTVSINLSEVYKLSEEIAPMTFSEKVAQGFKDGLNSFSEAMENIVIWFAESWIWVLIVLVVIAAAIIIPVKATQKLNGTKKK